jgi:3-phenylpropionate/trans-cinnamate dioxygenase ferredoxin subunit
MFVKVATGHECPPGTMKRVMIGGRPILIANVDGCFYAADDTCTHEDASLSKGSLKGDLVTCPLHGSRFNLRTGEVLDEPADIPLNTYAIRVSGSEVLVEFRE